MIRQFIRVVVAVVSLSWAAPPAFATPITYTFEAPQFTFGQTTPLLNRAPNIGPASFLTTFTSSPTANGFTVFSGSVPNPLFSGQHLIDPIGVADSILLSFNTPVFSLRVDFGLFLQPTAAAGLLTLLTPVGSISQPGGNVGGSFQGGTLVFNSLAPFTIAQLSAFNAAGVPNFFAIDNLVLDTSPVPEPATLALMIAGAVGIASRRVLQRFRG